MTNRECSPNPARLENLSRQSGTCEAIASNADPSEFSMPRLPAVQRKVIRVLMLSVYAGTETSLPNGTHPPVAVITQSDGIVILSDELNVRYDVTHYRKRSIGRLHTEYGVRR